MLTPVVGPAGPPGREGTCVCSSVHGDIHHHIELVVSGLARFATAVQEDNDELKRRNTVLERDLTNTSMQLYTLQRLVDSLAADVARLTSVPATTTTTTTAFPAVTVASRTAAMLAAATRPTMFARGGRITSAHTHTSLSARLTPTPLPAPAPAPATPFEREREPRWPAAFDSASMNWCPE